MRVIPLAAESLGVRSMATYVEAGDLRILIDPGATLPPTRWGLPPAQAEGQSPPRPHGVDGTPLGHVVGLAVCDLVQRERFVFASDVQGPLSAVAAAWLIQQRPTLLYLSGPPSYVERDLPVGAVQRGIDNLRRVLDATGCRVIMDHHALRDSSFAARFDVLWSTGHVITAAAHLGLPATPLEAQRRALWSDARKPPVAVRRPVETGGAIMTRAKRTFARRGNAQ